MRKTVTEKGFLALMKKLSVPAGFTAEFGRREYGWGDRPCFVMKSEDEEIIFDLGGAGHTRFRHCSVWKSFDRLGVSDSFYWRDLTTGEPKLLAEIDAAVTEQLKKITDRRAFLSHAISLPGLGFSVSPEGLDDLKKTMARRNGSRTFMPSGFGIGKTLARRRIHDAERADPRLESMLGISPLYVESFDAD